MKRIFGCLLLLVPIIARAEDVPTYRWLQDIELPEIIAVTPISVPLDSMFFNGTRDGWPDVRLHDQAGNAVAFLIRTAHETQMRQVRQFWPAEQQSASVNAEAGLQVELKLRDRDPTPHGVRIITPLRDFEHQVRIEFSEDGQTWMAPGPPRLIFDYSSYVDARNVLVPFDAGTRRRIRLIIKDITAAQESQLLELHRQLRGSEETNRTEKTAIVRRPFRVDRIEFYRDEAKVENSKTRLVNFRSGDLQLSHREKEHQSMLLFHTSREPLTEIKILSRDENFSRAATVEAEREDARGQLTWQCLASGTLTKFAVGTTQQEDLTLQIPETRAANYRVVIENRDSPALQFTGVELTGPLYELTFLASPRQQLTLEYGSAEAKAGRYDTAALQAALSQGQAVLPAKLQEPRKNENSPDIRGKSWQPWNDTRILVTVILALAALLGWGLYNAGRDIAPPPEN